ncbi:WD40-repeat-containing domain protein [Gongronella butleri]|nr:WD40-repeat-containing domain protein [Gongronella butleri]
MNLELLAPWEQEYPTNITDTLADGYILFGRFNRRGTLFAAGCQDGRCLVYDVNTKGIARSLLGHVKPIASLSWARSGRYLLSGSKDWTCILWDLLTATKCSKVRFDTPVMMAQMHPKKNDQFVVALFQEIPVMVKVNLETGKYTCTNLPLDIPEDSNAFVTSLAWNKPGTRLYLGTSKGHLHILDPEESKVVYSNKICAAPIKGMQWSHDGRHIIINANDRTLRLYHVAHHEAEPQLQNKFQDLVNRVQWNRACFSADGEFVCAGSGHKAEHNVYIWDKKMGNLVKILEGPNEPLDDVTWHPEQPIIATVSSYGNLYLWTTKHEENWSAFAPDFTELQENLEYEEQEDEFDVVPDLETKRKHDDEENVEVDVVTCDKIKFVDSDGDDDDDEHLFLPQLPLDDDDIALLLPDDAGPAKKKVKTDA